MDPPEPKWWSLPGRWLGRARPLARQNAWLLLVAGAALVLTKTVDFSPPPEVRVAPVDAASLVGDAPTQEFSRDLPNPQAIQVRATLRLYERDQQPLLDPEPVDETGKILAQPVVTTILGMNATTEQTVRLEGGALEVDIEVRATPRKTSSRDSAPVEIEHELSVHSRRKQWWRDTPMRRVHLQTREFLTKVEQQGHRVIFAVDDHLFSLDLEVHRPRLGASDAGSKRAGRRAG